jgi:hypothetical protein
MSLYASTTSRKPWRCIADCEVEANRSSDALTGKAVHLSCGEWAERECPGFAWETAPNTRGLKLGAISRPESRDAPHYWLKRSSSHEFNTSQFWHAHCKTNSSRGDSSDSSACCGDTNDKCRDSALSPYPLPEELQASDVRVQTRTKASHCRESRQRRDVDRYSPRRTSLLRRDHVGRERRGVSSLHAPQGKDLLCVGNAAVGRLRLGRYDRSGHSTGIFSA